MTGRRPFGVTLVAVLAWISGALQIVLGFFVLLSHVPWLGLASMVIGVITILVSFGLFGGRNGARLLMAIVFVANIASAIYLLAAHPDQVWSAVADGVVPLLGLVLLFSPKANRFFG